MSVQESKHKVHNTNIRYSTLDVVKAAPSTRRISVNTTMNILEIVVSAGIFILINRLIIQNYGAAHHGVQIMMLSYIAYFTFFGNIVMGALTTLLYRPMGHEKFDSIKVAKVVNAAKDAMNKIGLTSIAVMSLLGPVLMLLTTDDFTGGWLEDGSFRWFLLAWSTMIVYAIPMFLITPKYEQLMVADNNRYMIEGTKLASNIIRAAVMFILISFKVNFVWIMGTITVQVWVYSLVIWLIGRKKYNVPKLHKSQYRQEKRQLIALSTPAVVASVISIIGAFISMAITTYLAGPEGLSVNGIYIVSAGIVGSATAAILGQLTPLLGAKIDEKTLIDQKSYNKIRILNNYLAIVAGIVFFFIAWEFIPVLYGQSYESFYLTLLFALMMVINTKASKYWQIISVRKQNKFAAKLSVVNTIIGSLFAFILLSFLPAVRENPSVEHVMRTLLWITVGGLAIAVMNYIVVFIYSRRMNLKEETHLNTIKDVMVDGISLGMAAGVFIMFHYFIPDPTDVSPLVMAMIDFSISMAVLIPIVTIVFYLAHRETMRPIISRLPIAKWFVKLDDKAHGRESADIVPIWKTISNSIKKAKEIKVESASSSSFIKGQDETTEFEVLKTNEFEIKRVVRAKVKKDKK